MVVSIFPEPPAREVPPIATEAIASISQPLQATGWPVLPTHVTYLQVVDEAQKAHRPLREYAPTSAAAREYAAMVGEYLAMVTDQDETEGE